MPDYKKKIYLKSIFLISFIAVISAYFIEYILGYQPCNLCIIERIPYILSLILLLINFKFSIREKYLILLLIIIFVFSLVVSLYHFGIEQGFFQESFICDIKDGSNILSKNELLAELQQKTISCKDVTFRIFGFSLTTINIIISFIIITLLTIILKTYEKNQ